MPISHDDCFVIALFFIVEGAFFAELKISLLNHLLFIIESSLFSWACCFYSWILFL